MIIHINTIPVRLETNYAGKKWFDVGTRFYMVDLNTTRSDHNVIFNLSPTDQKQQIYIDIKWFEFAWTTGILEQVFE